MGANHKIWLNVGSDVCRKNNNNKKKKQKQKNKTNKNKQKTVTGENMKPKDKNSIVGTEDEYSDTVK